MSVSIGCSKFSGSTNNCERFFRFAIAVRVWWSGNWTISEMSAVPVANQLEAVQLDRLAHAEWLAALAALWPVAHLAPHYATLRFSPLTKPGSCACCACFAFCCGQHTPPRRLQSALRLATALLRVTRGASLGEALENTRVGPPRRAAALALAVALLAAASARAAAALDAAALLAPLLLRRPLLHALSLGAVRYTCVTRLALFARANSRIVGLVRCLSARK